MRTADLDAVQRIERASFSTPWPSYAYRQEIENNRLAHYIVARESDEVVGDDAIGDQVVGFAGMWMMVDQAHITTFAVDPAWHRHKIGTRLLLNLAHEARRRDARHLTLEVRVGNEPAQAMYRKFGFRPAGIRKNYYVETNEDALVMWADDVDSDEYAERLAKIEASIPGRTIVEEPRTW